MTRPYVMAPGATHPEDKVYIEGEGEALSALGQDSGRLVLCDSGGFSLGTYGTYEIAVEDIDKTTYWVHAPSPESSFHEFHGQEVQWDTECPDDSRLFQRYSIEKDNCCFLGDSRLAKDLVKSKSSVTWAGGPVPEAPDLYILAHISPSSCSSNRRSVVLYTYTKLVERD